MMRTFTYKGGARLRILFLQLTGLASIIIFTLFGVGVMTIALQQTPPYWCASCIVIWFLLLGWLFGLTSINIYPTVQIDDEGLVLSAFFFKRISVPWNELIDVGSGKVPFGGDLIRARHITPFHRVYGLLYSRSLWPAFLIGPDIEDREELDHEIRRHMSMAV